MKFNFVFAEVPHFEKRDEPIDKMNLNELLVDMSTSFQFTQLPYADSLPSEIDILDNVSSTYYLLK